MKNSDKVYISAVIVAAGKGTRMNIKINKQYLEIGGMPVLARTLQAFEYCSQVDEVVLVVNEQELIYCKNNIVDAYELQKVKILVSGGATRQESVYKGLKEVDPACGIVLIHDGARPFITEQNINDCIAAAQEVGASCLAVPVKDTIKAADASGFVKETFDRSILWSVQTPQTFNYRLVMDAHLTALKEGFTGTDDAMLVERLGHPLKLVMGSYDNIKITTSEDIEIAEAISQKFIHI